MKECKCKIPFDISTNEGDFTIKADDTVFTSGTFEGAGINFTNCVWKKIRFYIETINFEKLIGGAK